MKQRIFSIFIAAVMIVMLIPSAVFAYGEAEIGHNHADGYCFVCRQGDTSQIVTDETYEEGAPAVAWLNGNGYPSLQSAVQAANDGDTIELASDITITVPVIIDKDIDLKGNGYTVFRGFSGDAMFIVANDSAVDLINIAIDGKSEDYDGYSIFNLLDDSELNIDDNDTILKNSSAGFGGAIYITENATFNMSAGQIIRCSADNSGGAIFNMGTVNLSGNSYISENNAYWGGAIHTSGKVNISEDAVVYGSTDYDGYGDNIHTEGSDLITFNGDFGGTAGINTNDYTNIEGQQIAVTDGQIYGIENIRYDFTDAYYAQLKDDNTIILTAGQAASYTVYFNTQADDVPAPDPQTVEEGGYAYNPGDLYRDGYTLEGWYQEGGWEPFDFNTPIYGDITLYASWTPVEATTYTVYFNTQADDVPVPDPQTVEEGGYAYNPGDLYRDGYTLDGWYQEGAFEPFDFNTTIYGDITLYAQWSKTETYYTVTFDIQTDEIAAPESEMILEGETAFEPYIEGRTDFEFEGWYEGGADAPYDFNTPVYNDITLYADWEAVIQSTVKVTYYPMNGEDSFEYEIAAGEKAPVPGDPAEMEGYEFKGWHVPDSDTPYDFELPVNDDLSLYGMWEEIQTPEQPTDPDEQPTDPDEQPTDPDEQPTDPDEQPTDPDEQPTDPDEQPTDPDEQPTDPTKPNTYTVTFYTAHGDTPEAQVIEEGGTVNKPADPQATGYIFGGWFTDEACTKQYNFNEKVNSYFILYAKWTEQPTEPERYSVTFYTTYGITPEGQLIESGGKVTKPADLKASGYKFGGWFIEDENNPGKYIRYDFDTPVTRNMTLYAKWTEEKTEPQYFKVSYYTERGTIPAVETVEKGMTATKPNDPQAEGYVFGGWYTDKNLTTLYDFNKPVTENFTLYAKWTQLPTANYIVSFSANGHGNSPAAQTVKGGSRAVRPSDPKATGYTFNGWYTDPACTTAYNFNSPVNSNFTLYAGWTANRYTVKFDANGGVGTMASQTYVYDTKANLPANAFTRSGYYFVGWNTAADGSGMNIADQGQIRNLTDTAGATVNLYAQWRNVYNVLEGANAKVYKGSTSGITFKTDGDYNKFTGIRIDGNNIASTQYSSWAGSTYVKLSPEYINLMPRGTHTITFMYKDGSVETKFEVVSSTPTTGDTNNMLIWIIIAIAALLVIAIIVLILLSRRRRPRDYYDD